MLQSTVCKTQPNHAMQCMHVARPCEMDVSAHHKVTQHARCQPDWRKVMCQIRGGLLCVLTAPLTLHSGQFPAVAEGVTRLLAESTHDVQPTSMGPVRRPHGAQLHRSVGWCVACGVLLLWVVEEEAP